MEKSFTFATIGIMTIFIVFIGATTAMAFLSAEPVKNEQDLVETLLEQTPAAEKSHRTITTSATFERGDCPQPEELLSPQYSLRVDKTHPIDDYVPGFLVDIRSAIATKHGRLICLDETAALHLSDMVNAMQEQGYDLVVTSGYRSYYTQDILFDRSIQSWGHDIAQQRVAPPGHSEHQLGTTVDLSANSNGYVSAGLSFANTPEYTWMLDHAHDYGFVLSYPEGMQHATGYMFEPWHWRYVGVENIKKFSMVE